MIMLLDELAGYHAKNNMNKKTNTYNKKVATYRNVACIASKRFLS